MKYHFRIAYDHFDLDKICSYDDAKIQELAENKDIIRNMRKIQASVGNAILFRDIKNEYGTFYQYLCKFTGGKVLHEIGKSVSSLSDAISNDLKKRGMKFVGSTIIYSYLQAIGVIDSHEKECDLYKHMEICP